MNKGEPDEAKAAIQALNHEWEKCFENHDLPGLTALFTEDCIRMPQGAPASIGRAALEAAYRRDFMDAWKSGAKVRLNAQEILIAGEYAFARGADTLLQDGDDHPREATSKWMFVYHKQADGTWKFHWVSFNSDEP
jgi:uncharacterized protein (TIGR02246 family)